MEQDALFKKHTTMGQAINIGLKCNAWRTVLTHYSPRYQKIAETSDNHLETKTMIAFDHMRLSLSHFEFAYKMVEIYKKLLSNEDDKDDKENGKNGASSPKNKGGKNK